MKKLWIASVMLITGCVQETQITQQNTTRIAGSESEKPLSVSLSAEYKNIHPGVQLEVAGGGTDAGISALITGRADIANASRMINSTELNTAKVSGINIHQVIIAQDVIAIVTHPSVGVEYITIEDLKRIYDGSVSNWNELGGPDQPICPVGRSVGSGTRTYMLHRLGLENFCSRTLEFETYEDILNTVSTTRGAIAYVNNSSICYGNGRINTSVWVMSISLNGMPYTSPLDQEDILYGDYPLMRPLFQYYTDKITPEQMAFLEFELSEEGQQLVEKAGYVRLSENQMNINRKNATRNSSDSAATMNL